jgi:hypothetical protein
MGDDAFHYFRSWIVGKGRACFDTAINAPDELGPFVDNPEVENESLEYVPREVLESRSKQFDSSVYDDGLPSADEAPLGEQFDEDSAGERYPKLAAQFNW